MTRSEIERLLVETFKCRPDVSRVLTSIEAGISDTIVVRFSDDAEFHILIEQARYPKEGAELRKERP